MNLEPSCLEQAALPVELHDRVGGWGRVFTCDSLKGVLVKLPSRVLFEQWELSEVFTLAGILCDFSGADGGEC